MKALITGIIIFLIWGILATWYYSYHLFPVHGDLVTAGEVLEMQENVIQNVENQNMPEKPDEFQIYFDFDKAEVVYDESLETFTEVCKDYLQYHSDACLIITGHADSKGSTEYNEKLGKRRAEAVKEICLLNGLSENCIKTFSKGESEPVADNRTEEGRAKNRRAQLIVEN